MSNTWDRRRFLTTLAGSVPALALAPGSAAPERIGRRAPWAEAGTLPPRVVGLRTDGGDFRFDPDGLVVAPGEDVVWLNMGDFHSTTAFHPDNGALVGGELPLRIPEGADSWHSGMLGLTDGTDFRYTFTVEGVYDYFCQPHYFFGMVGRIVVGTPHGGPGTTPMDGLPDVVRQRMPELSAVVGVAARPNEWASRFNGVLYLLSDGRDAGAAVRALAAGVATDTALARQAEAAGRADAISAAATRFVKAVEGSVDYETLVTLADDAKGELGALAPAREPGEALEPTHAHHDSNE